VSSPLTGTFDEVKGHAGSVLYRKMLEMAAFVGAEDAPAITTIVNNSGQLVIPAGYESIGVMSKDQGLALTPSINVSTDTGYGYGQPIRRDITNRDVTPAFTMKESKRKVFETYYGVDLSQIKAAMTTRELKFDQPDRASTRYVRLLFVGIDGDGANAKYHAEWFPRCSLTDVGDQTWSEDASIEYPVTFGADFDARVATSQRTFWAGPGMTVELVAAMGFTVATS
jgi:hypothetical protein